MSELTVEEKRARNRLKVAKYVAKHKEQVLAAQRERYARHKANKSETWLRKKEKNRLLSPKYQEKRNEYLRRLRAEDPQRCAMYSRKSRLKKLETEAGRPKPSHCEVCGRNNGRGVAFDHCHRSGKFRGWICYSCNTILGHCEDNPEILRKLIDYLSYTPSLC